VLVSSHLLPEMAVTAAELVVIGRGRLIAQSSTAEFVDSASRSSVRVDSPQLDELAGALRRAGVEAGPSGDGALLVTGAAMDRVGRIAADSGLPLSELSLRRGSLEEAFMHITGHDVEYTAGGSAGGPDDSAALAAARR
jgi:ABC-2 type transport system ATP-binding protein